MGSYEMDADTLELHYTGDEWTTIKITKKEYYDYLKGNIKPFDLFNDGREVY